MSRRGISLPMIRQVQQTECGHACVAMLANYFGHRVDLQHIRHLAEPSAHGMSMLDLLHLLEKLNLSARAIKVDFESLSFLQTPAILHWEMNHFVVLKKLTSTYAIIHDPAFGKRKISLETLSNSFTGIAMEVEKAPDFSAINTSNPLQLIDLVKGVKGLRASFMILLALSLAIELFVLINPLFLQYVTDQAISANSLSNLSVMAGGFILLTMCHTSTEYMRGRFVVYLTKHLSEYFSSGVMRHILNLPLTYFERRHKGDILSRFHAIQEIQNKITIDSITALLDGLIIIFSVLIMSIYNAWLTLIVILVLLVFCLLRIFSYSHLKNQTETVINDQAHLNSKFLEIIQSILPIKLATKEALIYNDWKNGFVKVMNADVKIAQANHFYNLAALFLFNMEHIAIIICGAFLVINNQFSVGMLIAFLAYRQTLVTKSTSFIQKIMEYRLVTIQLERLSDIIMQEPESEKNDIFLKKEIIGELNVHNLSYGYPGGHSCIFQQLNLHIKPGEKVVITGPSGVGKTTLLKIMLGLIEPTEGHILIDGISITDLGKKNYRNLCAAVMQEDALISGSILDNITFMDTFIDIHQVYEAAKTAEIHQDILNMAMGYETCIGDMVSCLSGGQKQRLLIARALYKKPKILFLDEATSHLDVATEIRINQALKELAITQVVIAHRLETINMADRVVEMKYLSTC